MFQNQGPMTSNNVIAHGLLIESKDGQEKICSVISKSHEFRVFFSEKQGRMFVQLVCYPEFL